eukprot:gene12340-14283_t
MAEAMNVELLFPFLAFMIEDMGYTGEQLGYHAGILAASFCGAQFCTSVAWGMISDIYGRKFAMVAGTLGAGLGMLIFGFSKTFYLAILGRIVGGFLNGNLGVVKSFITEITDETNRSAAFYLFSLSWAVGSVCAPLVGGMLCKPAEKYPFLFSSAPGSIWVEFPYLFPCLITVALNVLASVMCMMWMVETVGVKKEDLGTLVVTKNELRRGSESLEEGIQMSYMDSPSRAESSIGSSVGVRNRSMSTDKHTTMSIGTRAGKADRNAEYSRLPLENAAEEYVTDYDSTMVHRKLHELHSSQTSSSSSAGGSPRTNVSDGLEYEQSLPTLTESEVNKLAFSPGQISTSSSTNTVGRVRNRSRSRSTSDGQDRYVHMTTTDLENSLRVPSCVTQSVHTSVTVPDSTVSATSGYSMARRDDNNDSNDHELSDMEDGDCDVTDETADEADEICCPTLLDRLALLGSYLRCTNKTRVIDTSMESSSHGLIESDSTNSLQSMDDTVDTADSTTNNNNTNGTTKLSAGAVLTQRVVILATLNYAMTCASSILIEETLPLFMKLDTSKGGFGFDSTEIGALLSTGAAGMMVLTVVCMPLTNGVSNKFMSKMSLAVNLPLCMSFPFIAMLNNAILVHLNKTAQLWLLWPLLILINTLKNLFSCFMFTSSIIMVNHSVTDEYLGAVNGLGQSLGALARSLGPAVGGLLWSVATKYNFIYLNFIAVSMLFALNYYVSYLVPDSLDHRKKEKRGGKKR